ncbi:ASCH domain-containing protein [Salinicola rhizosphaerae]|uniref:RNA-binding protein n=1 Tax=Salinicola rhizosphaerae TaxID=1443141 RepID=A0ABQ3DSG5_9GAMM|nr:ASCH domain-containing protein [Salinicola rhizosphaerae]GHB07629.1 RNA-binding protein [Salinicola rhizosphaerae]
MNLTPAQSDFLQRYRDSTEMIDGAQMPGVVAECFGDRPVLIDECARLIHAGIKRASCSWLAVYRAGQQPLPEVGQLTIVLDSAELPVCIIRLTAIDICRFDDVSPEFATLEGEGDGSYSWWHREHLRFFRRQAAELNIAFTGDAELLLEYFEKVFP